jgi:glucokinase
VRRARELADDPRSTPRWRALIADRGEALSTRDCHELAAGGDRTGQTLFAEAGTRLGQAAAGLVNVLAPERVIIGGGVSQAGELLLAPCREMVARHVMSPAGQRTPVVLAELGTHAAAMGAAALAVPGEASP